MIYHVANQYEQTNDAESIKVTKYLCMNLCLELALYPGFPHTAAKPKSGETGCAPAAHAPRVLSLATLVAGGRRQSLRRTDTHCHSHDNHNHLRSKLSISVSCIHLLSQRATASCSSRFSCSTAASAYFVATQTPGRIRVDNSTWAPSPLSYH